MTAPIVTVDVQRALRDAATAPGSPLYARRAAEQAALLIMELATRVAVAERENSGETTEALRAVSVALQRRIAELEAALREIAARIKRGEAGDTVAALDVARSALEES